MTVPMRSVMLWCLPALFACTGKDDTGSPSVVIGDVTAEVSPVIPTVVTVRWTTDVESVGFVTFGDGRTTPIETVPATEHSAVLLGLHTETATDYQVVVPTDGGDLQSDVATVTTGILSNVLPTLTLEGDGNDLYTVAPILGGATGPAIIDATGNFVWYYPDTRGLDVYRAHLSRDGASMLYNAGSVSGDPAEDSVLVRVSLDGTSEVATPVPLLAHDFVELPDGTLSAIAVEYRDVDGSQVRGDKIVEVAPDGTQTDVWSAWDCFDPAVDIGTDAEIGWTFANALDYEEADDAYYLSIRNFSSIVKIDRASGQCEWVFGTTAATITPAAGDDVFLHEHQFDVVDGGIVVFDNAGAGSVSRVVEYSLDPTQPTADEIWSFYPDPSIYTFVLGDVQRLDGGDTLVDFAVGGEIDRVTPAGEVTWRLNTALGYAFGFFEAEPDLYVNR